MKTSPQCILLIVIFISCVLSIMHINRTLSNARTSVLTDLDSVESLLGRISETMKLLDHVSMDGNFFLRRISHSIRKGFSRADATSLTHIQRYLLDNAALYSSDSSDAIPFTWTCSHDQRMSQLMLMETHPPNICADIEYYKIAQLVIPKARNFLDAGASWGYIGAEWVALWGGSGWDMSPLLLHDALGEDLRCGFCPVCREKGIPLYCSTSRRGDDGSCVVKNPVRLLSFDGSKCLDRAINNAFATRFRGSSVSDIWRYVNLAVSNESGVVNFDQIASTEEEDCGFEGYKIRKGKGTGDGLAVRRETVGMTTVDDFLRSASDFFSPPSAAHVLKFDLEGHDLQAIIMQLLNLYHSHLAFNIQY